MSGLSINKRKHVLLWLLVLVLSACTAQAPVSPTRERSTASVSPVAEGATPEATKPVPKTPVISNNTVILFVRANDVWLTDLQGENVEQLTTNETLDWQMGEGHEWRLIAQDAPPTLSPNGEWVALSPAGREILLINLKQDTQIEVPRPGAGLSVWSPDSRYIAYAPNYEQLYIYDVKEERALSLLKDKMTSIFNIVWSPDGQHIAFGCCYLETESEDGVYTRQVKTVDITTGMVETVGEMRTSVGGGTWPLCWTNEGEVVQADAENRYTGHHCSYTPRTSVAISPDGELRAYLQPAPPDDSDGNGASLLTIENTRSGALLWERKLDETIAPVAWSPDGQYLLLDDTQSDSPIWRLKADNSLAPEIIVSNGYLLSVGQSNDLD